MKRALISLFVFVSAASVSFAGRSAGSGSAAADGSAGFGIFAATGSDIIDDLVLFNSTGATQINGLMQFNSTGPRTIQGNVLFKSTGETAIEGFRSFNSTGPGQIGGLMVFNSTGPGAIQGNALFKSTGETAIEGFRAFNTTGPGTIQGWVLFTATYTASSGGGGTTKNYFTVTIGTSSTGYNNGVDFVGTNETPFKNAISSLTADGGTLLVRRGTYTFGAPVEISSRVTVMLEAGAVFTNHAATTSLFSTSGTIRGDLHIVPTQSWDDGGALLAVNTSGYVESVTLRDGTLGAANLTTRNSPIILRGKNATIERFDMHNTSITDSGVEATRIVFFDNCTDCNVSGGRVELVGIFETVFFFQGSSYCAVENMYIKGNLQDTIDFGSQVSSHVFIRNNVFHQTGGNMTQRQTLVARYTRGLVITGNTFKHDGSAIGLAAIDNSASAAISSATIISNNVFSNYQTGVQIEGGGVQTLIYGNQFLGGVVGVSVEANADNTMISGNIFTQVGTGVNITASTARNTFIHGNVFISGTAISDSGTATKRRDNVDDGAFVVDD